MNPFPIGLELLAGLVLLLVIVVQGLMVLVEIVVILLHLVSIVFDWMGLLLSAMSMFPGIGSPREPNQPRDQQCDGEMLRHCLLLRIE